MICDMICYAMRPCPGPFYTSADQGGDFHYAKLTATVCNNTVTQIATLFLAHQINWLHCKCFITGHIVVQTKSVFHFISSVWTVLSLLYTNVVYVQRNRHIQWFLKKKLLDCIFTRFVWWWLCALNWWETTGSHRRAEILTTGTPIQTQWQTLWWHLLLLRESTSALNKACNHTVVTWEQTKQCRRTVNASYTDFSFFRNVCFCLSDLNSSAIVY